MTTEATRRSPTTAIWFGNFFEPFYSDREAVTRGLEDVKSLGFNTVVLDSKPWEDFFARYRGEPASRCMDPNRYHANHRHERGGLRGGRAFR